MNKVALITGITGQDGSYLAELLLEKGYQVHGIIRRCSTFNTSRIDHIRKHKQDQEGHNSGVVLHYGDMIDAQNLESIVNLVQPDLVFHLAAQSHVMVSFTNADYTMNINSIGSMRLFDAIARCKTDKQIRVYNACTSEMFGQVLETPQTESTPFNPRSPYAIAKLSSYYLAKNYRERGMFITNGILFNHESPRRGSTFVTKKTTEAVAKIKLGLLDTLFLGNLDAKRDWGHAREYVEAMWLMLQQDKPDDFVIATGITTPVREMVSMAFSFAGIPIEWKGEGIHEVGILSDGREVVKIDPSYYRPTEVDLLIGDPKKARDQLNWSPKTTVKELIQEMVYSDIDHFQTELLIREHKKRKSSCLSDEGK